MTQLVIATRNKHKTREFAQLLGDQWNVVDLTELPTPMPAVEETGRTFEENAVLKAVAASRYSAEIVVGDDSGLEVDGLNGAPGIYSARYAGENASDVENVTKLLRELQRIDAPSRGARFRCVLAAARAGSFLWAVEGAVEGMIADQASGNRGFGYDPVFVPTGFQKTFAELGADVKNRISHRARAIAALRERLATK